MNYAKRDISVEPSDAFLKSLKKLLKSIDHCMTM